MVFKICEEISCSSFCDKELDVIIHKKEYILFNPIKILAILYPKSLAYLKVEMGARQSHLIQLALFSPDYFGFRCFFLLCCYLPTCL